MITTVFFYIVTYFQNSKNMKVVSMDYCNQATAIHLNVYCNVEFDWWSVQ